MAKEAPRQGQHSMPDGGATDFRPVSWDEAFGALEEQLRSPHGPDGAISYTSDRTSNDAAFGCQFLVLGLGANSLTDCFKMCHDSGGIDLTATLGIGPLGMQCRPGLRPEADHFRGNRLRPWAGPVIPQPWLQAERIP